MATDKELLEAFKSQINTGFMFSERQVLILMGYARGEERSKPKPEKEPIEETEHDKRMMEM
jgi:hypothetical protein